MIEVTLNGQPVTIAPHCSIAELLAQTKRSGPAIAVEINGDVVPREQHATRVVEAGDVLEVVTLVGGG